MTELKTLMSDLLVIITKSSDISMPLKEKAKTKRAFLEPIMLFYFEETAFLCVWKAFEVL